MKVLDRSIPVTNINIVEKNFSRNPHYYHTRAESQSYVSLKIAKIIEENSLNPNDILELGCGTGFLTEKLFNLFPSANFAITDLSDKMVQFTEHQTKPTCDNLKINASFLQEDVTKISSNKKYDLIVSSLVFQWLDDLSTVVTKLKSLLTPNGVLIFSTLTCDTFKSVKQIFNNADVLFPEPKLLTSQEILNTCKENKSSKVETFEEVFTEHFDSMLEFLRHIQDTGAGNASGSPISLPDLKKVLRPSQNKPIDAEYHISYVICRK